MEGMQQMGGGGCGSMGGDQYLQTGWAEVRGTGWRSSLMRPSGRGLDDVAERKQIESLIKDTWQSPWWRGTAREPAGRSSPLTLACPCRLAVVYLLTYLFIYLPICLFTYLLIRFFLYLFFIFFIFSFVYLLICSYFWIFIYLFVYLFVHLLSVSLFTSYIYSIMYSLIEWLICFLCLI